MSGLYTYLPTYLPAWHGPTNISRSRYHVPAHLSQHIDFVYPGVVLAESKRSISNERLARRERPGHQPGFRRVAKRQDADCSEVATPECIAALYNIPAADKAHPNNSMGFFQKTSFYQEKDLDLFFEVSTYPASSHPRKTKQHESVGRERLLRSGNSI